MAGSRSVRRAGLDGYLPIVAVYGGGEFGEPLDYEVVGNAEAEIKAVVSGIYITSIKNLRNVAPPEPEKRGLRAKLTKKSAEFMRKNKFLIIV